MSGKIILEKKHRTATLIISNPQKKNAMSYQMWEELTQCIQRISEDTESRVLILTGDGDDFSSGADITEFSDLRSGEQKELYDKAVLESMVQLKRIMIPTMAHIKGACHGGGFALAMCCDFRFSHLSTVFSLPIAKRGLGYHEEGIENLIEVAGMTYAKDILFTGRKIDVQEAWKMGITEIINNPLKNPLDSYVTMLSENAPLSLQAIKAGFLSVTRQYHDRVSMKERMNMCSESEDYKEATNAFLEKRIPKFKGK